MMPPLKDQVSEVEKIVKAGEDYFYEIDKYYVALVYIYEGSILYVF